MTMPLVPGAVTAPATPTASSKMLTALVTVTGPKSPGSSTSISPPASVLARAPAKVRHGKARVHGLASFPDFAETQVRLGGAAPGAEKVADTLAVEFIVTEQAPV